MGVSCAGGAQEGEREVRGTQAGARGQLALVPSMAWGRVGVGLSTGQQTPPASPVSPAAAQERHTGFRGLGVRPQGQLLPTGEVACSPSPVLEGWVCSGKVTWLLPAAPGQQAPWGGPSPPLGCTHLSPGHPPPAPGGAVRHRLYHPGIKGHCPAVDLTSLPSLSKREGLSNKPRSPGPHRLVPSLARNPTTRLQSFEGAPLPLTPLISFPSSSTAPPSVPPFIKTPSSSLHAPPPSHASPPLPRR